jgi:hypothetical protein
MKKQLESPLLYPFQAVTYTVLALSFAYILDDLLAWLGWRFVQNEFSNLIALTLGFVLVLAFFLWRTFISHMELDHGDFVGLIVGCAFAGLVLACYTVHPVAGLITILVFSLVSWSIFRSHANLTHIMVVTSMVLAFGAGTVLVSQWLYPGQTLQQTRADTARDYHLVTGVSDTAEATYAMYICNTAGIFCNAVHNGTAPEAESARLLLQSGAVTLLLDGEILWQFRPSQ